MKLAHTLLPLALLTAAAQAATISGTVSDRTTNRVAVNDQVVLIGFGRGMQEIARTTTDAHGHYSLQIPDEPSGAAASPTGAAGTHLVRVDHQKATYFQPAPPGAQTVDIDVYDVSEKVKGISTEADVLSLQTDPTGLHIVENYFVRNDSKPPMTQLSRHAYEIYLPPGVKIEASAAMGPAGMPVASSPAPAGDPATDPGHYAFVFPIRPGETRFQVSYHLPYSGSLAFTQKVALPTENLVVMLPKSMQFTPQGAGFQSVPAGDNGSQTFVRKNVAAAQSVQFTVAGSGSMPREAQGSGAGGPASDAQEAGSTGQPNGSEAQANANQDNRPGGGLGPPIDTPDPLNKYKWWILSALALVLVAATAWLLRKPSSETGKPSRGPSAKPELPPALRPTSAQPPAQSPAKPKPRPAEALLAGAPAAGAPQPPRDPAPTPGLLAALKEAVFALETERLSGQMSDQDYQRLKASLEVVLRQALERESLRI